MRINRRDLVKGAAGAAFLSLLPACSRAGGAGPLSSHDPAGPEWLKAEPLPPLPGYRPRVAGAWFPPEDSAAFYRALKHALEAATDFSWLSRGDRVLLKIALNSGNAFPATTDPWLLAYTVAILKEKGAGEVLVGDQSGVHLVHWTPDHRRGSSRALCESAGLLRVIRETGAVACFFEERGYDAYIETSPPGPHHWPGPLWVTDVLGEVDHVVYLARVSSHVMADVTSGLKLAVGFLREDSRRLFHKGGDRFYAMYEEVNQAPEIRDRFRVAVSSGRQVLANLGPDSGHVSTPERGLVVASDDLLPHELLSYAWLSWNRCFRVPGYSRATTGRVTRYRSGINRALVRYVWGPQGREATPAIPFWEAGDLYGHPALRNRVVRMGGRPEAVEWERVNRAWDERVEGYLMEQLRG